MKRKISMVLAVMCLVFSITSVSQAAGKATVQPQAIGGSHMVQPYYVNAAVISAALKIEGNTAYCNAEVGAKKVCRVTVTMRLQRKEGGSWFTVSSWVETSTNGVKNMTKSFTLTKRGTYRVYAKFDVAGEQLSYASPSKTY